VKPVRILSTGFGVRQLPRSGLLEQPHQLGLAIPLRSIASRLCGAFPATASPGIAALTSSSALPRRLAPEQGARPDTGERTYKLRLSARPSAQVSAAIGH